MNADADHMLHPALEINIDVVDHANEVVDLVEAEDVVVIPAANVAEIFKNNNQKCDSDQMIAEACRDFVAPEGWTR